jgi:hypothetical protein
MGTETKVPPYSFHERQLADILIKQNKNEYQPIERTAHEEKSEKLGMSRLLELGLSSKIDAG